MMIHRVNGIEVMRFVFPHIASNMFVLLGEKSALIIDPHQSDAATALLVQHQVNDIVILLTHEHPDHTSGVNLLQSLASSTLICQQLCAESIAQEKNNRPILISFILAEYDKQHQTQVASAFNDTFPRYSCCADITFEKAYHFVWQGKDIRMIWAPGHSRGSCIIIIEETFVFSGDSLLKDVPVITRFPGGNTKDYHRVTLPFLQSLDQEMVCFPGHGLPFTLGDVLNVV